MASPSVRLEHDLLGNKEVPAGAYYGVQTLRALENFRISGVPLCHYPELVEALAMIKMAAAQANFECRQFNHQILAGIEGACQELIDGKLHEQFQIDMFQGGAGTSTNMNANEVIANRALELMGKSKGAYEYCSPHDHVNGSQSTNDAYPSALHIALALGNRKLVAELRLLARSLRRKGTEFSHIVKMGRTQLQDAVPMTLGQEFAAFATTLREDVQRAGETARLMLEVNLGGTAIGTGIARISRPTASTRCSAPGSPIARCWAMPWPAPPRSGAWITRTNTARSSNRPCRPGGPVPTCRVAFRGLVRRSRSSSFRTQ